MKLKSAFFFLPLCFVCCFCKLKEDHSKLSHPSVKNESESEDLRIIPADERFSEYLPLLRNKNVALLVNQTSLIGSTHLIDTLLSQQVRIKKIFAPEHGFRGDADAGEKVESTIDSKTGLPVISLYGNHKKPTSEDLEGIDIVVFDIQDVGARFYTYVSTMHYAMESCAENKKTFLVLDRPNPNGFYVDGPVLDPDFKSFVGMHPVPVVHGMTVAEYAKMINEEGWLESGVKCDLQFVLCENYDHNKIFEPPVKPSPNLPNIISILLYPSICFFEGTIVSVGRGTDIPFQQIGHPMFGADSEYYFKPVSGPGAKQPLYQDQVCYGYDLSKTEKSFFVSERKLQLKWLLEFYNNWIHDEDYYKKDRGPFFNEFFTKLAGSDMLQQQIEAGLSEDEIRLSWIEPLQEFKTTRKKYLLYPNFE